MKYEWLRSVVGRVLGTRTLSTGSPLRDSTPQWTRSCKSIDGERQWKDGSASRRYTRRARAGHAGHARKRGRKGPRRRHGTGHSQKNQQHEDSDADSDNSCHFFAFLPEELPSLPLKQRVVTSSSLSSLRLEYTIDARAVDPHSQSVCAKSLNRMVAV